MQGLNDTHPEVERIWIKMLRDAGSERRAQLASRLSNQVRRRARRAIAEAQPHLSQLQQDVLFAEVHYGREVADRLHVFLTSRGLL